MHTCEKQLCFVVLFCVSYSAFLACIYLLYYGSNLGLFITRIQS